MSSCKNVRLRDIGKAINDISIISDASFLSDEEDRSSHPPIGDIFGKQVHFNSAVVTSSSPETEHITNNRTATRSSCLKQSEDVPRSLPVDAGRNMIEISSKDEVLLPSSLISTKSTDVEEVSDSMLDLSMIDDFNLHEFKTKANEPPRMGSLSMGTPQYNTVCSLQHEVMNLAERVSNASSVVPSIEAQKKALDHLTGRYDVSNKSKTPLPSLNNIPVAVNFSRKDSVFVDLLEISVCESEIVREERTKVAQKRRHLAKMIKKNAKPEILPEPSSMKFFDPQKHVFQSARVHLTGLPNLMPELRPFPCDHLNFSQSYSNVYL